MKLVKMLRSIGELVGDGEYKLPNSQADSLAADDSAIVLAEIEDKPVEVRKIPATAKSDLLESAAELEKFPKSAHGAKK